MDAKMGSESLQAADAITDVLPPEFQPGEGDVICQRGKECYDHVGNQRFREVIHGRLADYMETSNRQAKSNIVSEIVGEIREYAKQSGGGFVRKDLLTRRWFRVGDKLAREKVGQALRDAIKIRRAGGGKNETKYFQERQDSKRRNIQIPLDSFKLAPPDGHQDTTPTTQPIIQRTSNAAAALHAATLPDARAQPHFLGLSQQVFENQLSAELEPTPIIDNQTSKHSLQQQQQQQRNLALLPSEMLSSIGEIQTQRHALEQATLMDRGMDSFTDIYRPATSDQQHASRSQTRTDAVVSSEPQLQFIQKVMLPTDVGAENTFGANEYTRYSSRPISSTYETMNTTTTGENRSSPSFRNTSQHGDDTDEVSERSPATKRFKR